MHSYLRRRLLLFEASYFKQLQKCSVKMTWSLRQWNALGFAEARTKLVGGHNIVSKSAARAAD
jgi:hypothetical protein